MKGDVVVIPFPFSVIVLPSGSAIANTTVGYGLFFA